MDDILFFTNSVIDQMKRNQRPSEDWEEAFMFYNRNNRKYYPLRMSCKSCYAKVLSYIIEEKKKLNIGI